MTLPRFRRCCLTWLLYTEDVRKVNTPVTVTLLRNNLSRSGEPPTVACHSQLTHTIEVLSYLDQAGEANGEYVYSVLYFQ